MSQTYPREATILHIGRQRSGCGALNLSELLKITIAALRSNKIKALLTMLGVVIGSACIVLVVTISLVGKNYIIRQIEAVGSNIVYAELVRTGSQTTTLGDEITVADLAAV